MSWPSAGRGTGGRKQVRRACGGQPACEADGVRTSQQAATSQQVATATADVIPACPHLGFVRSSWRGELHRLRRRTRPPAAACCTAAAAAATSAGAGAAQAALQLTQLAVPLVQLHAWCWRGRWRLAARGGRSAELAHQVGRRWVAAHVRLHQSIHLLLAAGRRNRLHHALCSVGIPLERLGLGAR